jgi:hypothetical protein
MVQNSLRSFLAQVSASIPDARIYAADVREQYARLPLALSREEGGLLYSGPTVLLGLNLADVYPTALDAMVTFYAEYVARPDVERDVLDGMNALPSLLSMLADTSGNRSFRLPANLDDFRSEVAQAATRCAEAAADTLFFTDDYATRRIASVYLADCMQALSVMAKQGPEIAASVASTQAWIWETYASAAEREKAKLFDDESLARVARYTVKAACPAAAAFVGRVGCLEYVEGVPVLETEIFAAAHALLGMNAGAQPHNVGLLLDAIHPSQFGSALERHTAVKATQLFTQVMEEVLRRQPEQAPRIMTELAEKVAAVSIIEYPERRGDPEAASILLGVMRRAADAVATARAQDLLRKAADKCVAYTRSRHGYPADDPGMRLLKKLSAEFAVRDALAT